MGHDLNKRDQGGVLDMTPWLDSVSAALVSSITRALSESHAEVRVVILFGSVARHEERPLDDDEPSDVDLLVLVDPGLGRSRLPLDQTLAIYGTVGRMEDQHRDAPREVQVTLAEVDLADWDSTFVENIAREGIVLWARGPLPASLAPLTTCSSDVVPSLLQG